MRITVYTIEEANRRLTEVRPRMETLVAQKREYDRLEAQVGVLRVATHGADAANPDALELRRAGEALQQLGATIGEGLGALRELGVVVKDLDSGLCDFYSLKGDRLVFLCWRVGEPEVGHWHALDDGFAGRRPLRGAELD